MSLRVVDIGDAVMAQAIADLDPFQLANTPLRLVATMLPPETITTLNFPRERIHVMPIRVVEQDKAPARMFIRGGIASKNDYLDILKALDTAKAGQAFVVDMEVKDWVDDKGVAMKKPEVIFANSLRRRFEMAGQKDLTAYQSGKMQITVRRLTQLEVKERAALAARRGSKKKR